MKRHGGALRSRAIRSLACALGAAALLCAARPAHGSSLDGGPHTPQRTDHGGGVDRGRRTKLVEYDYEACPQVPSLHCRHGSTCTPGAASFGKQHDHLGLQTQESGYHCACPPGYVGHECEVEVDDCDGDQACYHGATCRSDGREVSCDCATANAARGPSAVQFAGTMCEHASTSMCAVSLVGSHAPNHQFCTNHGTCLRLVTSGEPHPGCVCTDGWMGDHCEIRRDPFVKMSQQKEGQGDAKKGKTAVGILIVTTVMLVGILTAAGLDVRKRRRAANLNKDVVFKGPQQFTIDDSDGEGEGSLPAPADHRSARDVASERVADGTPASDEAHVVSDDEDGGFVPQTELV